MCYFHEVLPIPPYPVTGLWNCFSDRVWNAISEVLTSLPSLEVAKEKNKCARGEKHALVVSEALEMREERARPWPQIVPNDVVYGCLSGYYEGSRWLIILIFRIIRWRKMSLGPAGNRSDLYVRITSSTDLNRCRRVVQVKGDGLGVVVLRNCSEFWWRRMISHPVGR